MRWNLGDSERLIDHVGATAPSDGVAVPETLTTEYPAFAAIGVPAGTTISSSPARRGAMEGSLDVDEERRRELLIRIRYMATSGLYADHTAIDAQLSLNINYPLVSECFADEVFKTHIDEMCSRVRKEHSSNGASDQHAKRSARTGRGEGEETRTTKAMNQGPEGERRKAEIAIAKLIDRIAGLARENGLSSVANMLDMASFLARTERKAEANPPEHDTTEHVSEHDAGERAAETDTTEQHEATEKAAEDGAGAFEQQASERSPEHETGLPLSGEPAK